jgi:hypothetical protein
MADARLIEAYDAKVAEGLLKASQQEAGLSGFLGVRFTEFAPGRLRSCSRRLATCTAA